MDIKVVYHSQTGNTKKIADAIAEEAGIRAEKVSDCKSVAADVLFIGDGIYAAKPNKATVEFIRKLDAGKVKKVAVFGTFGGQKKAIELMQELLKKQGINVVEESFGCRGKAWFFLNRAHPNVQDLLEAKEFTKRVIGK